MKEFTIKGGVESAGDKWRAEIVLTTPDGRVTRIESGNIYATEQEAVDNLEFNIDRILRDFNARGVEVLTRNGVEYS